MTKKNKTKINKEKIIVKILFFLIFLVSLSIIYKGYQKIQYKDLKEKHQTLQKDNTEKYKNLFLDKSFEEYKKQNKWYQNIYILLIVAITIIILFFI
jgi:cell division protein FtsL